MSDKTLYVVARGFKDHGIYYPPGRIITDLASLRNGYVRLREGKLIEIPKTQKEIEDLSHYLLKRLGIDLRKALAGRDAKGSVSAEPKKPSASANPTHPGAPVAKAPVKPLSGQAKPAPTTPVNKK
jgi:hypothetical protein